MKKCIAVIISVISMLCLAGCQKTIQGSEVYTFPEPTIQVTGTFYSAGTVTEFVIGSDKYDPDDLSTLPVLEWFYRLEMITCEKPEDVEGGEVYGFYVLPSMQRKGVGKALLDAFKQEVNNEPFYLYALKDNQKARAFYIKNGGDELPEFERELPEKYNSALESLFMFNL